MSIPTEEICFIRSEYYCISFIKTIHPPENIQDSDAIRKYNSIIFNTIVTIARSFNAKIVKNLGDGLVYYFPKTNNSTDEYAFKDVIECGLTVIAARHIINAKLWDEKLPTVNYRISADYGKVEVAKSITSPDNDLFGSPMNLCSKINAKSPVNEMVMGDNLYQNFKRLSSSASLSFDFTNHYNFKQIGEYFWVGNNDGGRGSDNTSINNKDYQNNSYKIFTVEVSNSRKNKGNILGQQRYQQHQQKQEHIKNNNIMIVDDEQDILFTYKVILAESGYNVKTFTDPYEALLHYAQGDPAYYKLIVLDIRIPNLNGLQLYNRLKAINKDIKIVFISALDAAKELVSMLPYTNSNDIIIRKPVEKEYLVNRLKAELA